MEFQRQTELIIGTLSNDTFIEILMSADLFKKETDALNDGLITSSLGRIVPDEARTVLAVGDKIDTPANGLSKEQSEPQNPHTKGIVESPDITCVIGRAKGPDSVRIGPVSDH